MVVGRFFAGILIVGRIVASVLIVLRVAVPNRDSDGASCFDGSFCVVGHGHDFDGSIEVEVGMEVGVGSRHL